VRGRLAAVLGELLDSALSRLEASPAEPQQLLAALPELQRVVDGDVAALEATDDLVQLPLELFEANRLVQLRTSSTTAPSPPDASSTSIRSPAATAAASRTRSPPERTIA
jgi:hypothetical protein